MSQYENFRHRFFEKIENFFDFRNSIQIYEFLDHLNENSNFLRKITNESFVKIDKIHENLHFFQIRKTCSIDNVCYFFRIHTKIIHR